MKPHSTTKAPPVPAPEPSAKRMFRKLETLELEMEGAAQTGQNRWIVPYADLLTLLLGLFLVLFATTHSSNSATASPASVASHSPRSLTTESQSAASLKDLPQKESLKASADFMTQLETRLQGKLNLQGIDIRRQERGVVISLKDSILFAPGQADLSPQARQTLDRLTDQLRLALGEGHGVSHPIRVEGHTDNTPITTSKYPSNWELSTARATNIIRYLVARGHFSPNQLSAAGYGEFRPVDNNSSIEGKQKNRRVDIVVLNDNTAHQEPPGLASTSPVANSAPLPETHVKGVSTLSGPLRSDADSSQQALRLAPRL